MFVSSFKNLIWCVPHKTGAVWEESGAGREWWSACRSVGNQSLPHGASGKHSYSISYSEFWFRPVLNFTICFQNLVKVMTICPRQDLVRPWLFLTWVFIIFWDFLFSVIIAIFTVFFFRFRQQRTKGLKVFQLSIDKFDTEAKYKFFL